MVIILYVLNIYSILQYNRMYWKRNTFHTLFKCDSGCPASKKMTWFWFTKTLPSNLTKPLLLTWNH